MNIFKKYSYYRELGKYKAQLKYFSMILRRKKNFVAIDKLADSAKKALLINQANQKLDAAWNQYHDVNIDSVSYKPHEKEFLEAMATMQSAEDGWKLADEMLGYRKELEIPWYARGFMQNRENYVTWLFLMISIMLIVTAFLVIFWMYPRWVGVTMIIVLLFAFFLLKSDSDLLTY